MNVTGTIGTIRGTIEDVENFRSGDESIVDGGNGE
jgi:hypothetical protein